MADLNGTAGTTRGVAVARAASVDPMSRVLATGPRIPVAVTIALAVFLHVGMAAGATAAAMFDEIFAWQRGIRDIVAFRLSQYEVEIIKEPPPPDPPKEEPPKEEEKPAPREDTPPPPPQPAQAGKILTADPDPAAPVDLTSSFVSGSASAYAGGDTSATGTSKTAVYNPAAANTGVVGGTGTAPAPAAPPPKDDKSRPPGLLGSVDWNDCPFPGEADAEQVDRAFVMIQVVVKPDGSPDSVKVNQDPGHGFGREARKCAMRKKYAPALDAGGQNVGGTTRPFRVHFTR